jgi:hypothetical protein
MSIFPCKIHLVDGIDIFLEPITNLMDLIYNQTKVLDQYFVAKMVLVYKNKGSEKEIGNWKCCVKGI